MPGNEGGAPGLLDSRGTAHPVAEVHASPGAVGAQSRRPREGAATPACGGGQQGQFPEGWELSSAADCGREGKRWEGVPGKRSNMHKGEEEGMHAESREREWIDQTRFGAQFALPSDR